MSEESTKVVHDITIVDHGSKALGGIASMAGSLSSKFNHLSKEIVGIAGLGAVAAGGFGLAEMVKDAGAYIGRVKRVSELTGMTAESTDGIMEGMKKVGLEGEQAESILTRMSRKGAMLEAAMFGARQQGGGLTREMKHLGVDMAHGPEKAMLSAAAAAQKGKIDATKLAVAFRVPMADAGKLFKLLQKGPESLTEQIKELRESGMAITGDNLATFARITAAKNSIGAGWERISVTIGKELLPVIAELLESVEKKIPEWTGYAKDFGHWLNLHLKDGLATATAIGKVLLFNAAIQKVTAAGGIGGEHGVGITGALGKAGQYAGGYFPAKAVTGVAAVAGAAPAAAKGGEVAGLLTSIASGFRSRLTNAPAKAAVADIYKEFPGMMTSKGLQSSLRAEAAGPLMTVVKSIGSLGPMVTGLTRLVGTVGVLAVLAGSIYSILTNAGGVADYLENTFAILKEKFGGLFSSVDVTGYSDIMGIVQNLPTLVAFGLGSVIKHFTIFFEVLGELAQYMLHPSNWTKGFNVIGRHMEKSEQWDRREAQLQADREQKRHVPEAPKGTPHVVQDFRGSHFDVKQSFAEGYDPDRVAVAFTDRIQSLGERRMQSSFSPLFSVK